MWSKLCSFLIALFTCGMLASAYADENHKPLGEAANDLPIFDAHIHYKQPAWDRYSPASIIELMDKNGVAMGLVSSTPDEGTIKLWKYAPNRVVPELRPYHGAAGSSNWTQAEGMEKYLTERLDKFPHEGIGEFHVHRLDTADLSMLRAVARMAKQKNIPIHIHSGAEPVRTFYEIDPGLTIIWAHAGMSEPPEVIQKMMQTYATLYADTSYREYEILGDGESLNPAWKHLLLSFSDRFMVGSDTWVNSQWDNYSGLITTSRKWLALLPRHAAEQIAYRNAERLFNRKIDKELLGTR